MNWNSNPNYCMSISQVIKSLQKLQETHGDLPVWFGHPYETVHKTKRIKPYTYSVKDSNGDTKDITVVLLRKQI